MKKIYILATLVALSLGVSAQTKPQGQKTTTTPAKKTTTTTTPAKTGTPTKTTTPAKNTTPAQPAKNNTTTAPAKKTQEEKPAPTATTTAFAKGDNIINIGAGFGHFYGLFGSGVGYPSVNLSYENIMLDFADGKGALGIGGTGGWWTGRYRYNVFGWTDNAVYTYNRFAIGPRAVVHYDLFEQPRLDTYAGLNMGLYVTSTHYKYTDPYDPSFNSESRSTNFGFMYGFFIGTRYYTGKSNKFGVFGELGYGLSVLRLGVALKL